jgi:hypothetical protein
MPGLILTLSFEDTTVPSCDSNDCPSAAVQAEREIAHAMRACLYDVIDVASVRQF